MSLFALAEAPVSPVVTTHRGDNADLVREVARLCLPEGARIADVTYGRGGFWRKVDLRGGVLLASDLHMEPDPSRQLALVAGGPTHRVRADFRALPYQDGAVDIVVLDPPYLPNPHGGLRLEAQYRNTQTTQGLSYRAILRECYCLGLLEAWRVLVPGGTVWVKGKDGIDNGHPYWSHADVSRAAERLGFVVREQFFLLTEGGQPHLTGHRQHHARKNQSWLWVFRRPPSAPGAPRGRPRKGSVTTTLNGKRGKAYLTGRLRRDHPQVFARYMAGELPSVHAAARVAGLVPTKPGH